MTRVLILGTLGYFAIAQPAAVQNDAARADLERVRQVNLDRAARLPSFAADEKAIVYTGQGKERLEWLFNTTFESEVLFSKGNGSRTKMRQNGTSVKKSVSVAGGSFGSELMPLFNPKCPTKIEFDHSEGSRSWYRFSSPADGCFERLGKPAFAASRTGRFLVDDRTYDVVRYEEEASFPKASPIQHRSEVQVLEYVKIGDADLLVPVSCEYRYHFNRGAPERTVIEYSNHRHF